MISVVMFTFKRPNRLIKSIETMINNKKISEILIFNDDETTPLTLSLFDNLEIRHLIKLYNPQDFGFTKREFRKHIYMNRSIDMIENNKVLFTDDDARFSPLAIDKHEQALENYKFCAGGIIRGRFFNRISKTILQGTNYSFNKSFFKDIGSYDETFAKSMGGGDVDFWFRIYNYVMKNNTKVAFIPKASQKVTGKSTRRGKKGEIDPKEYFIKKHNIEFAGPMYKWFPEIRDKKRWMTVIK